MFPIDSTENNEQDQTIEEYYIRHTHTRLVVGVEIKVGTGTLRLL